MTNLHISYAAANAQAAALAALAAGGSLVIYSGVQPATPETFIGASVPLARFALGTPAFGAPVSGQLTLNTPTPATILATFAAGWFRVFAADGLTALFDGNVGTAVSGAWAPSTNYALGVIKSANGNAYACSSAGQSAATGTGPTTAAGAIVDGTAVWSYLSAADADINFSSASFVAGNTVSISSYTFQVPGV